MPWMPPSRVVLHRPWAPGPWAGSDQSRGRGAAAERVCHLVPLHPKSASRININTPNLHPGCSSHIPNLHPRSTSHTHTLDLDPAPSTPHSGYLQTPLPLPLTDQVTKLIEYRKLTLFIDALQLFYIFTILCRKYLKYKLLCKTKDKH